MVSGGASGCGVSQASRLSTITSRNSSTTNAQRRARRRLTLTPTLTNRVSQRGHLGWPETAMPQYGQWLSIIPPGHDQWERGRRSPPRCATPRWASPLRTDLDVALRARQQRRKVEPHGTKLLHNLRRGEGS
jgi:hypothetical protein